MLIIISLFYFSAVNFVSSEAAQKLLSPKSLDYRQNGLVSKTVYNEKSCKAGWAFALIGEIEGQYAKRGDGFMDISVQQLIDCLSKCAGCSHCDAKTALKSLLRLNGLQKSDTYPFVAKKQSCRYRPDKIEVYIDSFTLYELKDENDLKKLLEANGPLYIALDSTDLVGHKDGVIKKCSYNKLNHAVLLIGYGSENGEDYWLVKNSWGSTWGHQGVGKLARGTNICGLMNSDFFTIDLQ